LIRATPNPLVIHSQAPTEYQIAHDRIDELLTQEAHILVVMRTAQILKDMAGQIAQLQAKH